MNRVVTTLLSLATAALLAAPAATAADIPGNASTQTRLRLSPNVTRGDLERDGDIDWYRLYLRAGEDYAFKFYSNPISVLEPATLTLRDPQRRPIRTIGAIEDTDNGFEYRAPRTGVYFVDITGRWEEGATGRAYYVAAAQDCRDDATTLCVLEPGRPQNRASLFYVDWDRFATTLDRTKRYTFTATTTQDHHQLEMKLLDARGAVVAEVVDDGRAEIAGFRPPRSGRYFLRLFSGGEWFGAPYGISMTVR